MINKDEIAQFIGKEVMFLHIGATKPLKVMVLASADDYGFEWAVWSRELALIIKTRPEHLTVIEEVEG